MTFSREQIGNRGNLSARNFRGILDRENRI